ncbi:MAG: hypothetical protein ABW133_16655 [Polyangiaceae bacterium]
MKILALCAAALAIVACGSEPGPQSTLYVDPPTDDSCIGVIGFEVKISPAGQEPTTRRLIRSAPVLAQENCKLPETATLGELALDTPVTVTVTGFDSSGASARVAGRAEIPSLRSEPIHLKLARTLPTLPTVLVFYRNRLLENVPWNAVKTMTIATQMGSKTLLTVDRGTATEFFEPEPGAFGISGLVPGGSETTNTLTVSFTTADTTSKNARITVGAWMTNYYMAN